MAGLDRPLSQCNPQMISRQNNFDLIRFGAALAVMLFHLSYFGLLQSPWLEIPNTLFPGVSVFFIISGFLVTNSWLGKPQVWPYLKARFLRIYPAFVISTLLTTLLMGSLGYFHFQWVIGQLSVFFLYHTNANLVPFGDGMPNGALWTIPVEVKFYLVLPLLLWFARARPWLMALTLLAGAVVFLNNDFGFTHHPDLRHGFLHNFWYFGFGSLARQHWNAIKGAISGHALAWLFLHLTVCVLPVEAKAHFLLLAFTLTPLVLAVAFAELVKWKHDISYGLYLYHSPYVHLIQGTALGGLSGAALALAATGLTALASWHWVERPALLFKVYAKPTSA
jgi:peptidoglycan/LPS O-acetylase OafA/YrhL